jgi:hypothetical protein
MSIKHIYAHLHGSNCGKNLQWQCLLRREKWVQIKIEVTFFPDLVQSVSLVQVLREEFDAFFISLWSTLGLWSIFVIVLLVINPTMATVHHKILLPLLCPPLRLPKANMPRENVIYTRQYYILIVYFLSY